MRRDDDEMLLPTHICILIRLSTSTSEQQKESVNKGEDMKLWKWQYLLESQAATTMPSRLDIDFFWLFLPMSD